MILKAVRTENEGESFLIELEEHGLTIIAPIESIRSDREELVWDYVVHANEKRLSPEEIDSIMESVLSGIIDTSIKEWKENDRVDRGELSGSEGRLREEGSPVSQE